jgi:hypothetical protein
MVTIDADYYEIGRKDAICDLGYAAIIVGGKDRFIRYCGQSGKRFGGDRNDRVVLGADVWARLISEAARLAYGIFPRLYGRTPER